MVPLEQVSEFPPVFVFVFRQEGKKPER